MSYVRIPDPQIVDLSAWHQLISVVNQHSDSLAAITNDFGVNYDRNFEGNDYSVQYDVSSQKIIYGRALVREEDSNDGVVWYESVNFITPFSARPVVTATILAGNSSTIEENRDAIVSVYELSTEGFSYRVMRPRALKAIDDRVWVNWIAVGPK